MRALDGDKTTSGVSRCASLHTRHVVSPATRLASASHVHQTCSDNEIIEFSSPPDPLAGEEGLAASSPRTSPRLGPSGLTVSSPNSVGLAEF